MTKVISRYFDIIVYSFLSWLIFSMASETGAIKSFINIWLSICNSSSHYFSISIFCLAGMLTKVILINSGDFNYRHTFHNESIYRRKDEGFFSIGFFDLKLKLRQAILNPPLRLSIAIFLIIIYSTNNIDLKNYLTAELACYFIGFITPQLIKSIKISLSIKPSLDRDSEGSDLENWHNYEKPILTLDQDRLNRGDLVNRLFNIITSDGDIDTRGIAIIGPFGVGKSSVINMAMSEVQMAHQHFILCRINSWGTYSSEEQIQKHLIEQVINSLGKVTSTTSLSGLPSKYIHTLKGAQSLWLDILPIFDNHSSPRSQLTEIDSLLVKLKLKIIIIIEDLDRNKDAEIMLNSIAPIIDRLNENGNFRFILSIGQNLNTPGILNRICRYKEYISFNKDMIHNSIKECLSNAVKTKKLAYKGHLNHFFSAEDLDNKTRIVRNALLDYIANPRELKLILRQVELDWQTSLYGYCDILDIFAITTLMHYEPIIVTELLNNDSSEIDFSKLAERNSELKKQLTNERSSELIVNYFFDTTKDSIKPKERLQSCRHDFNKYFHFISTRSKVTVEQREKEQMYFKRLFDLNVLCKMSTLNIDTSVLTNDIYNLTDELIIYRGHDRFNYDFNSLYSKSSLIPSLILIKSLLTENINHNDRMIIDYMFGKLGGLSTKNHGLAHKIIAEIVDYYLNYSLRTLLSLYKNLDKVIHRRFIKKPSVHITMQKFKEQHRDNKEIDMYLLDATLKIIHIATSGSSKQTKTNYQIFTELLINENSTFSKNLITIIKEYRDFNRLSVGSDIMHSLQKALHDFIVPNELIKENEETS